MDEGALPPAPVPEPTLALREQLDFWTEKVKATDPGRGWAELGVRWDRWSGWNLYAGALHRFDQHWSVFGEAWANTKGVGAMGGLRVDW
jgi:hypothetical protein